MPKLFVKKLGAEKEREGRVLRVECVWRPLALHVGFFRSVYARAGRHLSSVFCRGRFAVERVLFYWERDLRGPPLCGGGTPAPPVREEQGEGEIKKSVLF